MTQCLDADGGGSLYAHTQLGPALRPALFFHTVNTKGTGRLCSKEWGLFWAGAKSSARLNVSTAGITVEMFLYFASQLSPALAKRAFLDKRGRPALVQLGECRIEFAQTDFR